MKGFIKQLLTNRLGIILAALNLCYLFSRPFFYATFSFDNTTFCSMHTKHTFTCVLMQYSEPFSSLNLPAVILSIIPDILIQSFSRTYVPVNTNIQIAFFAFSLVLQWLLIGWTAKKIASAIRPKLS